MPREQSAQAVGSISDARRDLYRQQILTAAEIEFGRSGFANAPMNAIAATAGLSLATVYKTFAGKAEIWDALHADRMEALLAAVDSTTPSGASALDRLLAGVATVARFLAGHDTYLELNLKAGGGWASDIQAGRGVQRSVWSAGQDMIAAGVERAIAQGEIAPIRPRVAVGMIVSALQVWLSDWVAAGRDRDAEAVVDDMVVHLRLLLVGPGQAG